MKGQEKAFCIYRMSPIILTHVPLICHAVHDTTVRINGGLISRYHRELIANPKELWSRSAFLLILPMNYPKEHNHMWSLLVIHGWLFVLRGYKR